MQPFRAKFKATPPSPLVRQGPADNQDFFAFVSTSDGFRAYVHRKVLEYIKGEAARAAPDETIGLLAGRVCFDPGTGPYTLVLDADGARGDEVEASPGYVRITAAGQASVRARLERTSPDREIVGWYHSHPKYEARFSPIDETEQATWADPGHLGIVYSGVDRAEPFGVYRGPQADRLTRQRRPIPYPIPLPLPAGHLASKPSAAESTPVHAPADTPPQAPGARHPTLPTWALALALACLAVGIFWLGHRVMAVEGKLDEYARNWQPASPAAQPVVEPPHVEASPAEPSAPTGDNSGGNRAPVEDGSTLHSPAKTLSPERAQPAREKEKPVPPAKARRAAQAKERAAADTGRDKPASQPASTTKTNNASRGQKPAPKEGGDESKPGNKPPKQL